MSDNNAHPGVRSLLAKFENSQSPITSPPSRGRSPVGSDTPGSTRPLSKVRASFVTVDGAIGSSPGSPFRNTSGRSDSPGIFGPKINAEEIELRRQNNVVSPTPDGHGKSQTSILDGVADKVTEKSEVVTNQRKISDSQGTVAPAESAGQSEAAAAKKEKPSSGAPTTADVGGSSEKEKAAPKTVSKRPSNVHTAKQSATTKPTPHTTTSTSSRTTTNNGSAKPTSAREVAKERANSLAHKPSRPSLNPATKSTTRATRGATPSADAHKPSTSTTTSKPRSKSPTRPVRLPNSMAAQTQSSNAKHGTAGPATGRTEKLAATLTRKPSSLKSIAPAAAVRRQTSRPSLPHQPAPERPSSRVSDIGAKPVNESFLARMMRPTASSASKTHEKTDVKAPPKPAASKAPRQSMGRASERGVAQPKAKPAALKPQSEKAQPASKEGPSKKEEVKVPQNRQESEKENIEEVPAPIPEEPSVPETDDATVEEPESEVTSKAAVDDVVEKPTEPAIPEAKPELSPEPVAESTEPAVEPTATEAVVEVSTEPVAPNAPETSGHQEETTKEGEAPAEVSSTETTHESAELEGVPEVKDIGEVPAETTTEVNGEKESSESQPEPEAPKETTSEAVVEPTEPVAAEDASPIEPKETSKAEPVFTEQTETSTSASTDDVPEIMEGLSFAQISEKIQEPEESIPVVESAAPAKSDTVDIDFASLALS